MPGARPQRSLQRCGGQSESYQLVMSRLKAAVGPLVGTMREWYSGVQFYRLPKLVAKVWIEAVEEDEA